LNNFDGKKFYNQEPTQKNFSSFLRWILTRKYAKWPKWIEYDLSPNILDRVYDAVKVTYVNHSTFLIQFAGINILTDPVWSKTVSPFNFVGPMRIHAPGIDFAKLPKIDIVLISHVHYDHLDIETVEKLHIAFQPLFITGLKVGRYLKQIKNINYKELNWWEITTFNNIDIIFTPAQHWSSRSFFVKNTTLWGSFIIKYKDIKLYFAGDTGWSDHFMQIAQVFSPIAISMLPIGAYKPRWFMKDDHISPEEALKAHNILKSKISIGMHFNCFKHLADDGFDEAKITLLNAIKSDPQLTKNGAFMLPLPGQEYEIKLNYTGKHSN
jgi:L-ascorbate metabolism protein UlaG (beta-lactamase superfamily)